MENMCRTRYLGTHNDIASISVRSSQPLRLDRASQQYKQPPHIWLPVAELIIEKHRFHKQRSLLLLIIPCSRVPGTKYRSERSSVVRSRRVPELRQTVHEVYRLCFRCFEA